MVNILLILYSLLQGLNFFLEARIMFVFRKKTEVGSISWAGGRASFASPASCLFIQLLPIERAARKQKAQEAVAG